MADTTPQDPQSSNADHGHEPTDIHLRSVVLPGLALGGSVLVFSLAAWWMINAFAARPPKPDVALSPLAQRPQIPPQPRLQGHPAVDLAKLNATYDARLNSYGWVGKSAGRVHIPIEQAKDLVLHESQTEHRFGANPGRKTP